MRLICAIFFISASLSVTSSYASESCLQIVSDSTTAADVVPGEVDDVAEVKESSFDSQIIEKRYDQFARAQRVLDVTFAIVALPIVVPAIGVAAIGIKFESKGPIFFIQERVGLDGKVFKIYKLRTMKATAPADRRTAINDSRISGRWARFLRLSKLDEFPQILNILRGDMSFVGPRPASTRAFQQYCSDVPEFELVTLVKPGLAANSYCEYRGEYDRRYASAILTELENSGWRNYFKALLMTVPNILRVPGR